MIEGDEITIDLTGSSDEVPTGYNCPFEGTTVSAMTFITRMIFLDEVAYPVFVPQNEGMLQPVNVIAPQGLDLQPQLPARVLRSLLPGAARRRPRAAALLAPVIPDKITAGNSAHLAFIAYSGFNEEEGEYWVYLEVDEGSYGGRPGARRPRLRRLPDRQHAQQPDRGARVALPDAHGALRAARRTVRGRRVARRHRHGARQPLPRRHDRVLRGRPATSPIRRGASSAATTGQRVADAQVTAPAGRGVLAGEDHRLLARGRRHARDHGAELGRLRRSAASAIPSRCSPTCSTSSRRSSCAERDYGVVIDAESMTVDVEATRKRREELSEKAATT